MRRFWNEGDQLADLGDRIAALQLQRAPWRWAYGADVLPLETARELAASFPEELLAATESSPDSAKQYRMQTAELGADVDMLPAVWQRMYSFLTADGYRRLIQRLAEVSLAECSLEVSVWEYGPQDWLEAHVDKPDKVVTQIFYLSDGWRAEWGGRLFILSERHSEPHAALSPTLGASSLVVRSDESWHAVEPVAPGVPLARRSLTAMFRTNEPARDDIAEKHRLLTEALGLPPDTAW